jgi:hypothetical protein
MPTATADPTVGATHDVVAARPVGTMQNLGMALARWHQRATGAVPAASFVAFRIAFGLLATFSVLRFVASGWVGEFWLDPDHHLTYARFEWVRPVPAVAMYALMGLLAGCGLAIAAGWRYRTAAAVFAVGFAYTELIEAALYLNHYWFVTLVAVVLAVLPRPVDGSIPALNVWVVRSQLAAVYVFAGIAKLNPDWLLDAQPLRIWLAARTDRPLVGAWLDEPAVAYLFSWTGALFDLTIVAWLLWKRSRPVAYAVVVAFHLATAALFQIGVFPWVMILSTPIFFGPEWPRYALARLSRVRTVPERQPRVRPPFRLGGMTVATIAVLAVLNVALPLRHYAAPGNVRINDAGYYLSWRVMVSERATFVEYHVADPATGAVTLVRAGDLLEPWQVAQAATRPDLVLATAHLIADRDERLLGRRPIVTVDAWLSSNGQPRRRWIDQTLDLAAVPRSAGTHTYVIDDEELAG